MLMNKKGLKPVSVLPWGPSLPWPGWEAAPALALPGGRSRLVQQPCAITSSHRSDLDSWEVSRAAGTRVGLGL